MARVACLIVREFSLAAVLRIEPELSGFPVAITEGRSAGSPIVALSPEAAAATLVSGMTVAQARAVCDGLIVRARAPAAEHAATQALADVAGSITSRVETSVGGTVFLDCTGSTTLCGSEAELATKLAARAERQGFSVSIGIAGTKLAARVAARRGPGVQIVPPGAERAYLAPLPIALLDPDAAVATTLASWGIRSVGDLAALPPGEVAHRVGPAAGALLRRARGEDDLPLGARPTPLRFSEAASLEYAVDHLEPLLFLLRRLLDRMTGRLALHGLACGGLELRLELDGATPEVRRLAPAAPTTEHKVLLTVLRAHLEHEPPRRGVTGITLTGTAVRTRATQLDFFRPSGPASAALAATIARLAALCGPDRVGAPARAASHRPDAFGMADFTGQSVPRARNDDADGASAAAASNDDAVAASSGAVSVCRVASSNVGGGNATDCNDVGVQGDRQIVTRVALRAFRPPVALEVFENAGRLDYIRGHGFGGRVVHLAGPWHLRGEWWTVDPYAREYYDVELSDGGVYRIYRDARTSRWVADGLYD